MDQLSQGGETALGCDVHLGGRVESSEGQNLDKYDLEMQKQEH